MKLNQKLVTLFLFFSCTLNLSLKAQAATVYFEEDKSLPIVYLNIICQSGALQDPSDKFGLANIAGEMILRGTQSKSKTEFFDAINSLGAQINVEARSEGLLFRLAVLSKNLTPALALVEEAFTRPRFDAGELSKLKKEVESQILERKGNDRLLAQYHFYRNFYNKHPYGNPVIGTATGIKNISLKDVSDFYSSNFTEKNLTLVGSGDTSEKTLSKWFDALSEKFSAIHPEKSSKKALPEPTFPIGKQIVLIDKPGSTQSQIIIGTRGLLPNEKSFYPIELANYSFGGGTFLARLLSEVRVKRGWTYSIGSAIKHGLTRRHFGIQFFPKNQDTKPAIELVLNLYSDWLKNGITENEFHFAKDSIVNSSAFNYDTAKKRVENTATELLFNLPIGFYKDLPNKVNAVSYSSISSALQEGLNDSNLMILVVGNAAALKADLQKIPGITSLTVKSYLEE